MNLIESAESQIRANMDKCAFEINVCVQDQSRDGCHESLLSALHKYGQAATQLDVLEKVKLQMQDVQHEALEKETDEG